MPDLSDTDYATTRASRFAGFFNENLSRSLDLSLMVEAAMDEIEGQDANGDDDEPDDGSES
jgi:hypothetical protein